MSHYDIILRDATVVSHTGEQIADIGIADGKIAAVGCTDNTVRAFDTTTAESNQIARAP